MTLPKGWTANLPPSIHAKTSFASLDKTYKLENGILTTDRRLQIFQHNLPAAQWPDYHKWFKDAGLDGESYIQLIPSAPMEPPFPATPITEDNPTAADLIRQASRQNAAKIGTGPHPPRQSPGPQPQSALSLEQLRLSLPPGSRHHLRHRQPAERALPPSQRSATSLACSLPIYMTNKRPEDAIATIQAAIDRNPTDASLVLYLASIHTQRNENAAAEKVLRAGLVAIPASAALQMQLGQVLLREKKTAEGETLLSAVVTTSTDPLQLNNAAYELANNSLDLPLAETASRRSLSLLDQASNNGETGPNALLRAELITSAWDTYGWILYRDNKVAEAEPWIRAAWRNGYGAEPGYHLAILLENQNHLSEALNQLELASKGERGSDPDAVQKLIDAETAKLSKSAHPTLKNDPAMELQRQRTYKLPAYVKPTGIGWATSRSSTSPARLPPSASSPTTRASNPCPTPSSTSTSISNPPRQPRHLSFAAAC